MEDGWREYYWPRTRVVAVLLVLFYGGVEVGVTIGYASGASPSTGIVALLVALILFVLLAGWRLWHAGIAESEHGLVARGLLDRRIDWDEILGFSTRWESLGAPKVVIARGDQRRNVSLHVVQDKTTRWRGGETTDIVGVLTERVNAMRSNAGSTG